MMIKPRRCLPIAVVAALLVPCSASGQSKPNSGYVTGTQDVLSSIELADGRVAQRLLFQAAVTADDPSSPFNLASQDCFATYIFDGDVPVEGHGACDGISVEGDMWWLSLEVKDGIVHWTMTGGTGRFAELQTNGKTTILAQWDDGKFVARYEGTMQR